MASNQANWVQPELRFSVVAFNVNVRRFASVARVKEKSERSAPQHCRRTTMLPRYGGRGKLGPRLSTIAADTGVGSPGVKVSIPPARLAPCLRVFA